MDREYLEDYQQKEIEEVRKFHKKIREGTFSFQKDRFPPDERFKKLHKPVATASFEVSIRGDLWAQIPFCGSLILGLHNLPPNEFEKLFFKISEIPKVTNFIKETGKLQVVLMTDPLLYEGLDYLKPFFEELNPPCYGLIPTFILGTDKEKQAAEDAFFTLGGIKYLGWLKGLTDARSFSYALKANLGTYITLKLGHYAIVEDIENLMIDNPEAALVLFGICNKFIDTPLMDPLSSLRNYTLEETREGHVLPFVYQPQEIQFPCEIGKFLLKKLTYAPQGLDACKELLYHFEAYDLQKVQESMNEAIVTNHPDIINISAEELSKILDNVWNDKTIPKRIEGIRIGVPVSMAAIGGIAGALFGSTVGAAVGGFLAELGFKVVEKAADKFFTVKGEGLSEKLAKLRTKSYQANVYNFKKKYKK